MSDVRPHALAIVGVPQRGVVVLGAREQQIALAVVLDERQRALVAFQENRAHGAHSLTQTPADAASVRGKEREPHGDQLLPPPSPNFAHGGGSIVESF